MEVLLNSLAADPLGHGRRVTKAEIRNVMEKVDSNKDRRIAFDEFIRVNIYTALLVQHDTSLSQFAVVWARPNTQTFCLKEIGVLCLRVETTPSQTVSNTMFFDVHCHHYQRASSHLSQTTASVPLSA